MVREELESIHCRHDRPMCKSFIRPEAPGPSRVGAIATQARINTYLGIDGLALRGAGHLPAAALDENRRRGSGCLYFPHVFDKTEQAGPHE